MDGRKNNGCTLVYVGCVKGIRVRRERSTMFRHVHVHNSIYSTPFIQCYSDYNTGLTGGVSDYPLCSMELYADMAAAVDTPTCFRRGLHVVRLVEHINMNLKLHVFVLLLTHVHVQQMYMYMCDKLPWLNNCSFAAYLVVGL